MVGLYAAIETSFDETGIAVLDRAGRSAWAVLSSQIELHQPYGGCVPELAARTHLSSLPQLWRQLPPELLPLLSAVGVTSGPGLPGCLLAGVNFARGLAKSLSLPLYGLNHLSGHLFSPFMPEGEAAPASVPYPHVALLVSGGHTELYLVRGLREVELLGQTQDDAVGELFDKVSAMLGYGYPGGAKVEQIARRWPGMSPEGRCEGPYSFTVPMRQSGDFNFSYSGIKTGVVRHVRGQGVPPVDLTGHPALLAALFDAVLESLWIKVRAAVEVYEVGLVTVSGGVALNGFLRQRFQQEAARLGIASRFPQPQHCLDNAEMMAWLLKLYVEAGIEPEQFDARSNWNPGLREAVVS